MKKLESLGRSLTKTELKQISGGGWIVWTCNGTLDGPEGHLCDYHVVADWGEWQFCEQGCHAGCSTIGSVCYFPDSEA